MPWISRNRMKDIHERLEEYTNLAFEYQTKKRIFQETNTERLDFWDALKKLSKGVDKFLYDASFTPPWESAGSKWVHIIQNLDRTNKEIVKLMEAVHANPQSPKRPSP